MPTKGRAKKRRVSARPKSPSKLWQYEHHKSLWIAHHPEATAAEYQAAMTRLAQEFGV